MNKVSKAIALSAAAAALTLAGAGAASADSTANGVAANSPGFLSGNLVQVPVHIPINLCGNTVNVIALLNPAFGNTCVNNS
ncbi:chaplin [Streptacidiphilus fuscans]|uniref:Chaplin n=1 Tax=Streptacidiphilus fuscans TaxID=2789292 RepID=A0A931FAX9_9ACTN|nr:chaplin [Streptacidiphilus fuscans]MBF9068102.1 chaplin [Streptacidiphilus fuscans]